MRLLDTAWCEDYIPVRPALFSSTGDRMREGVAGQDFASPIERDHRARGHLRWRRCLVLVLLVACGTLPLLAQASPPDPTWLPGIYDNADYDDVIGLLHRHRGDPRITAGSSRSCMSRPLARFGELCFGCPRRVSARLSAPFSSGHLTPSPLGACHDRARTGAHLKAHRHPRLSAGPVPLADRETQSKFPGRIDS